jgi:hypothetical protein
MESSETFSVCLVTHVACRIPNIDPKVMLETVSLATLSRGRGEVRVTLRQ